MKWTDEDDDVAVSWDGAREHPPPVADGEFSPYLAGVGVADLEVNLGDYR